MYRYYLRYVGTTMCRAVEVWPWTDVPAGVTVETTTNPFEGAARAANIRAAALAPRPGTCGFCGGPSPCLRDD